MLLMLLMFEVLYYTVKQTHVRRNANCGRSRAFVQQGCMPVVGYRYSVHAAPSINMEGFSILGMPVLSEPSI